METIAHFPTASVSKTYPFLDEFPVWGVRFKRPAGRESRRSPEIMDLRSRDAAQYKIGGTPFNPDSG